MFHTCLFLQLSGASSGNVCVYVCHFLLDKYFCRGPKASIPVLTFEDIPQIKQEDFVARVSKEELASIKILPVLVGPQCIYW